MVMKPAQEYEALVEKMSSQRIGDEFTFGKYEQDGNASNGPEDIEWMVVDKNGGAILVVSKYALDAKPFDDTGSSFVNWENCSLRAWLNDDFLNTAFTENEQPLIAITNVNPDDNPVYYSNCGGKTKNMIFLLSVNEANFYLGNHSVFCPYTAYAIAQGAEESGGNVWWWLRTSGQLNSDAAYANYAGLVNCVGEPVGNSRGAVRPAMWIYP